MMMCAQSLVLRLSAIMLFLLAALIGSAVAQDYPIRPVRIIVPYPAGGGTDIAARMVTQKLHDPSTTNSFLLTTERARMEISALI